MSARHKLRSTYRRALALAGSAILLSTSIGCSLGTIELTGPVQGETPTAGPAITGTVHGGRQPIVGSVLQLYSVGTADYGRGATPLISGTLPVTEADGSFSVAANAYTCPASDPLVYLVAQGGDPGIGANNKYIALMTPLGHCSAAKTATGVVINEMTTVAFVYPEQNFMSAPTGFSATTASNGRVINANLQGIGATGSAFNGIAEARVGLANGFSIFNALVDPTTGFSPNPNYPHATPESARLGTIANIVSSCINSDPSTSSICADLLTLVTPTGHPVAGDTIQAIYFLAQNPTQNVSIIFNQFSGTIVAYPGLATPPKDWTVSVAFNPTYSNSGATTFAINDATSVAIDPYGNAYFTNTGTSVAGGLFPGAPASAVELGPDGKVIMNPVSSFRVPAGGGAYSQFTVPPGSTVRTINSPSAVAIDTLGRAWVPNTGDVVTSGAQSGSSIVIFGASSGPGSGSSGVISGDYVGISPYGIAIDGNNNVFVSFGGSTGINANSIGEFISAGVAGYTFSTSANAAAPHSIPSGAATLAVDQNLFIASGPTLWALNRNGCNIGGTAYGTLSAFTTGNLAPSSSSAFTTQVGTGSVVGNFNGNCGSASGLNANFSAPTQNPFGLAVDASNNLWISNRYANGSGFDGLAYLVPVSAVNGGGHTVYGPSFISSFGYNDSDAFGSSTNGSDVNNPQYIAMSGDNSVWIANHGGHGVQQAAFATGLGQIVVTGPFGGYLHDTIASSSGIAVDTAGNVWITNTDNSSPAPGTYASQLGTSHIGNSVTVILGVGYPTVSPLATAAKAARLGNHP